MKRSERRRIKREAEKQTAQQAAAETVSKAIDNLLNQFYITMRENKISEVRAKAILDETAKRINDDETEKTKSSLIG